MGFWGVGYISCRERERERKGEGGESEDIGRKEGKEGGGVRERGERAGIWEFSPSGWDEG